MPMNDDSPLYSWKPKPVYPDGPPILPGTVTLSSLNVSAKQKRDLKEKKNDGPWHDWRSVEEISGKRNARTPGSPGKGEKGNGPNTSLPAIRGSSSGDEVSSSSQDYYGQTPLKKVSFNELPNVSRRAVSKDLFPAKQQKGRRRRTDEKRTTRQPNPPSHESTAPLSPNVMQSSGGVKIAVYKSSSLPKIGRQSVEEDKYIMDPIGGRNHREVQRRILLNQF
jgi:hypothetical protein